MSLQSLYSAGFNCQDGGRFDRGVVAALSIAGVRAAILSRRLSPHRPASENVTRARALDAHGKTLIFILVNMDIDLARA